MSKRKKVGRPPSADKAEHAVFFRLTTAELADREKAAKKAGYPSVHAWAKSLLLGAKP